MRLEHSCTLFSSLNEIEQRKFFSRYRSKRDDDINAYINSKIKKPRKEKVVKSDSAKIAVSSNVKITEEQKLILKQLGLSLSDIKHLKG